MIPLRENATPHERRWHAAHEAGQRERRQGKWGAPQAVFRALLGYQVDEEVEVA